MATAPQNHAAEADDVYAGLFAELDSLTAAGDDTQENVEAGLETALAEHAATTPPVTVVAESEASPPANTPAAPANNAAATQVETQVEALVRANVEKMQLEQQLAQRTQEIDCGRQSEIIRKRLMICSSISFSITYSLEYLNFFIWNWERQPNAFKARIIL